jgi:UDP-glucose 4-epimerase
MSPYAVQKLTGEMLCGVFTRIYGLETVALRYFNVFGPRQDPKSEYAAVIPLFLTSLLNGKRPIVFGDGEQTRDFTYIENVVQANLLAATSQDAAGEAMNIGCGDRISLNNVLKIAGELLGVEANAEYREPRAGDVRDSLADINKAQRLLGYSPITSFREGLAHTLESLRATAASV